MIIRRVTVWLVFVGLCGLRADPVPAANSEEPAKTHLTWEECVRLATKQNPDVQASREAVINSDAVRMGAYSTLYPQISLTFGDDRSFRGEGLVAPNNYSTNYSEQASLSQTIFDGFATKGNIDRARSQLNLAFADLDAEKALISYQLKSAFAQLIYAQHLIQISHNVIDIRQNNARLVNLLYEGGREDKGARLLSHANLDQALNNLDQARRTRNLSSLQLAVVIGQDLPSPIEAVGELQTVPLPETPDYRKLALLTPAYFQRRAEADAAAAGITLAQSGFYPTISADVTAARNDTEFPARNHDVSAGFTVSYPLFEGGQTYFNVKAASATLRQALDSLRSGTDQAALTLAQMYKGLVDSQNNVRIQNELLDATALRYKIAEADYRNGLISFQDFTTITDAYVNQQLALLSAQLSAVIAEANWEDARGLGAIP